MSDSLNNKELVAVGHQFAKAMSSDTAIMDIAKIVSRLAERLDCTTAALREMTKQRDVLAKAWGAQDDHINQQADRIESLENTNAGLGKALGAAQKRIAEVEASHSKLRESIAAIHNTIRLDGAQTSLAVILNAAKRAHDESAAAAGISIKGEYVYG